MSEVASRPQPSRGSRGAGRGRGGFSGRGGRRAVNGGGEKASEKAAEKTGAMTAGIDEDGDLAELRTRYGDKLMMLKELFADWSDFDILSTLQDADGDENLAIERITTGAAVKWDEVQKKAPRSKPKETPASSTAAPAESHAQSKPARGPRTTSDRGRGRDRTERGGRPGRGRSTHSTTNGARYKDNSQLSVPTHESSAWDSQVEPNDSADYVHVEKPTPEPQRAEVVTVAVAAAPAKKTWASMVRESTTAKAPPKPKEAPPKPAEPLEPLPPAEPAAPEPAEEPAVTEEEKTPPAAAEEPADAPVVPTVVEPEVALPPPKDQLTETNLGQVLDTSHPPATGTAASTAADSWDPRNSTSVAVTPLSASQQQHQHAKAAAAAQSMASASSGFAASALKATTERPVRTPSYQRRVLDQEEAVRMPGNREVDRAAVQFGAFSLNGANEDDVDGDREEAETRAQPPDDSPVAHPRTSLPPAQPAAVPEPFPAQKPAVSLPAVAPAGTDDVLAVGDSANSLAAAPTAPAAHQPPAPSAAPQAPASNPQQYGRYGQHAGQESYQKPFDSFGQQGAASSQPQYDNFAGQQSQPPASQTTAAAASSGPDYHSYLGSSGQERGQQQQQQQQFNNFYSQQQYGQQAGAQGQQDSLPTQPRNFGGYNASASQNDAISQYPQSGSIPSRFAGSGIGAAAAAGADNSGHSTPNPPGPAHQQGHQQGGHQTGHQQAGYAFSHPYANHPYYQYYQPYNSGYPYGKNYGGYGMSPQGHYDHGSSQGSGFGASLHRNDSGLGGSGLGDYARGGQSGSQPGLGGLGGFGSHEPYQRAPSMQAQSQLQPTASNEDLKPDFKPGSGPSPSIGGARPGSAANVPGAAGQSGLPPAGAFGQAAGYPGSVPGGSGYGSSAGGGYGQGAGGFNSYGYGGGAGAPQNQRGWAGNYGYNH